MGSVKDANSSAGAALCERYAEHFPVRNHLIYLNHAAVAPLCKRSADAMKHLADDCSRYGSLHYPEWLAAYDGVRTAAAACWKKKKTNCGHNCRTVWHWTGTKARLSDGG